MSLTLWTDPAPSDSEPDWHRYAAEILAHAGLSVSTSSAIPDRPGVLIVTGTAASGRVEEVRRWVEGGGVVLLTGELDGLEDLSATSAGDVVESTRVDIVTDDLWTDQPPRLRALRTRELVATDSRDLHTLATTESGGSAITTHAAGSGRVFTFGVDPWYTIARIQQGYPVSADGRPSADGSAPIDDDLLKAEDGMALDIDEDRALPPGEPPMPDDYTHTYPPPAAVPIFDQPHADWWRSVLLQVIYAAADHLDQPLAWLGYWPAGIGAIAHMSHDADGNKPEQGQAALEAFAEADVHVTWHQVYPGGYGPEIYEAVTAAGHEQSLHYNAMDDSDVAQWGWPQFRAQFAWAQAVSGREDIVSNKNHYTRWEGWTQFYTWCERVGIQIDSSRGPSKQGTVGFPFGTAHVSFPLAPSGAPSQFHDVLNLPLHTQDLAWASHASVRDVILDGAQAQHGVAHFLFHGPHLHLRPPTRAACPELANEARRRDMPWWTAEQINTWERSRRGAQVHLEQTEDGLDLVVQAATPIRQAAILLTGTGLRPQDEDVPSTTVVRHGRDFCELTLDLPAGPSRWRLG